MSLAHHVHDGERVAVKRIDKLAIRSLRALRNLSQEVAAMRALTAARARPVVVCDNDDGEDMTWRRESCGTSSSSSLAPPSGRRGGRGADTPPENVTHAPRDGAADTPAGSSGRRPATPLAQSAPARGRC